MILLFFWSIYIPCIYFIFIFLQVVCGRRRWSPPSLRTVGWSPSEVRRRHSGTHGGVGRRAGRCGSRLALRVGPVRRQPPAPGRCGSVPPLTGQQREPRQRRHLLCEPSSSEGRPRVQAYPSWWVLPHLHLYLLLLMVFFWTPFILKLRNSLCLSKS